eukprot:GDKJ01039032.1.p1 GENE.GDKJ01039032.1~~GDKJ01039032.1.p1  ORF type:complete len:387 (+),score=-36.71 GDKJ01039032.1:75-1235(+)
MLLYSSLLTILLSLILVYFNFKEIKSVIYLVLFFNAFAGLGFMHYFAPINHTTSWLNTLSNYLATFYFLPGPLLYFYVNSALKQKSIRHWKNLLHLAPALTCLVANLYYNLSLLKNEAAQNWFNLVLIAFLAGPISMLVYSLIIFSKLSSVKAQKSNCLCLNKWIFTLSILTSIIAIAFILLFCIKQSNLPSTEYMLLTNLTVGLLLSTMAILLLLFPSILYGKPTIVEKEKTLSLAQDQAKLKRQLSFSEQQLTSLSKDIISYLEKEKPFLNAEFSMSHLAVTFNVPQHHIATCFNQIIKKKFTSLRTEFRVNYAKELLVKGLTNTLSIDGIGAQAGFTTRSHFYASLKSIVGCTPLAYLEKQSGPMTPIAINQEVELVQLKAYS